MPVMRVIDKKMVDRAIPVLKVKTQFPGTQVSTENTKKMASAQRPTRTTRSMSRDRVVVIEGGIGGSTDDSGSFGSSRERMPGRKSNKNTRARKGMAGRRPVCKMDPGAK